MRARKIKFSFASTTTLVAMLALGVGLVLASPLVDGGTYLPMIYQNHPTPTPTVTPTVTPTPTPTPEPDSIDNPGFEQRDEDWTADSNQGDDVIVTTRPHRGKYSAALGSGTNNRTASIAQQFYVSLYYNRLQYYRYIQSVENCGSKFDKVSIFAGSNKVKTIDVCEDLDSSTWKRSTIDLSDFAGDKIVFRMEYDGNSTNPSEFYVDDFSFIAP